MKIPRSLLRHRVDVEPHLGVGATGQVFGPRTTRRAHVEQRQRLVVDGEGREVTSSTRVWLELEPHIGVGSIVTLWPGTSRERRTRALAVSVWDHPGTPAHLQIDVE